MLRCFRPALVIFSLLEAGSKGGKVKPDTAEALESINGFVAALAEVEEERRPYLAAEWLGALFDAVRTCEETVGTNTSGSPLSGAAAAVADVPCSEGSPQQIGMPASSPGQTLVADNSALLKLRLSVAECESIAARLPEWCATLGEVAVATERNKLTSVPVGLTAVSSSKECQRSITEICLDERNERSEQDRDAENVSRSACYVAMCNVAVEKTLAAPSHAASLRLAGQLLSGALPYDAIRTNYRQGSILIFVKACMD